MKKTSVKKGFTLIEMLVSIAVFSIFITSVITAYINIAKSQRQANTIRAIYSETRYVFGMVTDEARAKTIDYSCYSTSGALGSRVDEISAVCLDLSTGRFGFSDYLALINAEGTERTIFRVEDAEGIKQIGMYKEIKDANSIDWLPASGYVAGNFREIPLKNIEFTNFEFDITPIEDPYDIRNVYCDEVQFQPSVTVYSSIKGKEGSDASRFDMDLQTSVSSRVYNKQTTLL